MRLPFAINRKLILLLKTVPLILIFTFIWIQFRLGNEKQQQSQNQPHEIVNVFTEAVNGRISLTGDGTKNKNSNKVRQERDGNSSSISLAELRELIKQVNAKQHVTNMDQYGSLASDDVIIVIQVHNRGHYLAALIDSLKKVKGIEKVLLIFSHDVYDSQINNIVKAVTFCKVSLLKI